VNSDATVITFHFRKGLKWSDGQPWSTADVMYWWNDMVLNPNHTDSPPDDVRDGKDKIAKVTAPDDMTLLLTFTSPAPVAVDRIAAYVNGSVIGPRWMAPKHYISKYNPVYNKALKPKGTWQTKHDQLLLWSQNPDCPTMVGLPLHEVQRGPRGLLGTQSLLRGHEGRRPAALHRQLAVDLHGGPAGAEAGDGHRQGRLRALQAPADHPCPTSPRSRRPRPKAG